MDSEFSIRFKKSSPRWEYPSNLQQTWAIPNPNDAPLHAAFHARVNPAAKPQIPRFKTKEKNPEKSKEPKKMHQNRAQKP